MSVKENWPLVVSAVAAAATRSGRRRDDIVIVGVTKYSDAAAVNEAVAAGLTHIAENRVQAAEEKFPLITGSGLTKHLIGHLQSNKARDAVRLFDLIQSVDSIKLVDEINKRAAMAGKIQDVLLQVDIAREEQKFGLPEEEAAHFVAHAAELPNIRLLGLMAMAPLTEDRELIRGVFREGKKLFDRLKKTQDSLTTLSMGMSHDYDIAIEEGATMVRIGSALFK